MPQADVPQQESIEESRARRIQAERATGAFPHPYLHESLDRPAADTDIGQFLAQLQANAAAEGRRLDSAQLNAAAQQYVLARGQSLGAGPDQPQPNVPVHSQPGAIERNAQITGGMTGGMGGARFGPGPALLGALIGGGVGGEIENVEQQRRQGHSYKDILLSNLKPDPRMLMGTNMRVAANVADRLGAPVPESLLGNPQSPGMDRFVRSGVEEATLEAVGGVAPIYGPMLARNQAYRVLGVPPEADALFREAEELGIHLGIKDVSKYDPIRGMPRTLGSFPWINTPMIRAYFHQADAVTNATDGLTRSIAPIYDYAATSRNLFQGGKESFRVFRRGVDERYVTAFDAARQADARVRTRNAKEVASVQKELLDALPPEIHPVYDEATGALTGYKSVPKKHPSSKAILKHLDYIQNLDDSLTVDEYRAVVRLNETLMDRAKAKGLSENNFQMRVLHQLNAGLKQDFKQIEAPQHVVDLISEANRFFKENIAFFESPTAQKFGRVDKRAFRVGFEEKGSLNPDELFKAVVNSGSPQAMNDLRGMLMLQPNGRKIWRETVSTYLDGNFQRLRFGPKQIEGAEVFDWKALRKVFGLNNKKSNEYTAFVEMMKGTGVTARQFETLINASERMFKLGIPDVAEFVRRRAILGGRGALARTFTGGVPIFAGGTVAYYDPVLAAIGATAFILTSRHFGKVITNPKALKAALEVTRPGLTRKQYERAMRRLQIATPALFIVHDQGGKATKLGIHELLQYSQEGAAEMRQEYGELRAKARAGTQNPVRRIFNMQELEAQKQR